MDGDLVLGTILGAWTFDEAACANAWSEPQPVTGKPPMIIFIKVALIRVLKSPPSGGAGASGTLAGALPRGGQAFFQSRHKYYSVW